LIAGIMFGEYKTQSSSLCNFLQSACFFLCPRYIPQHLIVNMSSTCFLLSI
jgi:hypothetical protein